MSEQIQKQKVKQKRELPEVEELPEAVDETTVIALADLAITHIDEVIL